MIFSLPVSYYVGYDKPAGYDMYQYPRCFEAKCYPCFSHSENRHVGPILISLSHQVPGCPGPDFFNAVHRVSPPTARLHAHFSPVCNASRIRSVSSGERPTFKLLTVTCWIMFSGSMINVARSAAPAGA